MTMDVSGYRRKNEDADHKNSMEAASEPGRLFDQAHSFKLPPSEQADVVRESPVERPAASSTIRAADVKALSLSDFVERAEKLLPKLDIDRNGYLSDNELAAAVQNPAYKHQDAQAIAGLYRDRANLKNFSNDEFFGEDEISKEDRKQFGIVAQASSGNFSSALNAYDVASELGFAVLDIDQNGFVTRKEMEHAIAETSEKSLTRQRLEEILSKFDQMQASHNDEYGTENDGITQKDAKAYCLEKTLLGSRDAGRGEAVLTAIDRALKSQGRDATYSLYGTDNAMDSIKPDAIHQGTVGNCHFLATLAVVAQNEPQIIANMITENPDGTFCVKFPGAKDEAITVYPPTQTEAALYNSVGRHGTWALVIEKAFGQYCQSNDSRRINNPSGGLTPSEGGDGGGLPAEVFKLLTGRDAVQENLGQATVDSVALKLQAALAEKRGVTACTHQQYSDGSYPRFTVDKFDNDHLYSVLDFKPNGKGSGIVTIRNPYGDGTGMNGTMQVPLETVKRNFLALFIQKER